MTACSSPPLSAIRNDGTSGVPRPPRIDLLSRGTLQHYIDDLSVLDEPTIPDYVVPAPVETSEAPRARCMDLQCDRLVRWHSLMAVIASKSATLTPAFAKASARVGPSPTPEEN